MSQAGTSGRDRGKSARLRAPDEDPGIRTSSAADGEPVSPFAASPGLNVLLIEESLKAAEAVDALLKEAFGERCRCVRVDDLPELAGLARDSEHDLLLIGGNAADNAPELVRSCIGLGFPRPIIVLAGSASDDLDFRAIDAGAVDCIPDRDLSAASLERAIRHALVRENRVARAHREIASLSAEIARINMLRDANHRFVDNACHDFRSPLTVIKEFSSIIADGLAGDVNGEQSEFLQIILTRVDQLSHMIDSILDASRLESDLISVRREEHSAIALIDQVRPTLEQQAIGHRAAIRFAIPDRLPNVFADAESIGRVLVNLGTNACKFAGEGGEVEVWARWTPEENAVTIGVTDNGPGIAPEHVKLIFDRFRQVGEDDEAARKGFGLGLHISSELVRLNFGTLSVDSEPKKGSTFAFTLPVFDIDALIPLHFGFLKTSRHAFGSVSIAMVTFAPGAHDLDLTQAERLLTRQLRSYDLLVRLGDHSSLACFACDQADMPNVTGRIQRAYAEHSRNRPDGPLPEIAFRQVGSWTLTKPPEGLTNAIRSAYALSSEAAGVH
jgi:signal transduction histidine kinase